MYNRILSSGNSGWILLVTYLGNSSHRMGGSKGKEPGRKEVMRKQVRRVAKFRMKTVKLRSVVGTIQRKNDLKCAYINVDGLTYSSLEDVKEVMVKKKPDVCILVETKRREEQVGLDISIDGYSLKEVKRSDAAGEKGGGGIAYYTRLVDGLVFHDHNPDIEEPSLHYVNKERVWLRTESAVTKTAICGAYYGCQTPQDHHAEWNMGMYQTIQEEQESLRRQGYRIIMLADFNGHVGNKEGQGIKGNHKDVNPNGCRFLNFLKNSRMQYVNGHGNLTKGIWTRQRGKSKTVVDYVAMSEEHLHTVKMLEIDDCGKYGGGSDHNWMFLVVEDRFIRKERMLNCCTRKPKWKIGESQDWSTFQEAAREKVKDVDPVNLTVDELASCVSASLLAAGKEAIGLQEQRKDKKSRPRLLPRHIVESIEEKRRLEEEWKTAVVAGEVSADAKEERWMKQKLRVNNILFNFTYRDRGLVRKKCEGKSIQSVRCFWRHVSTKIKQSMDLSAVVDLESGSLKCTRDEIKAEVEKHYCRTFKGSMEPVAAEELRESVAKFAQQHVQEHSYGLDPEPSIVKITDSKELDKDPGGWMDREYKLEEVRKALKGMKGGRAMGHDSIPNEFLIHAPDEILVLITCLLNKIKEGGRVPKGWNRGIITLIHKKGLRELLKNYRPVTVIISLSGLYSRVLNERLVTVVESQGLLGEDQNGFRKGRRMGDNNFILDTILWKARALGQDVHLAYVDISKAYDSVNREILWARMSRMGFGGSFLTSLQALYCGDSVESVVNGSSTRPVYLRRGLRQGCSLSPILFALYISDIGRDLSSLPTGFELGKLRVSALLFTDNIVLVGRSRGELMDLISRVKRHCDGLKLVISVEKSQVVSPQGEGVWDIGGEGEEILSLKAVLSYKYLGTETTLLMSSTGSKRQQKCIRTAQRYRYACHYVGKTGPDVMDVVLATWSNIAIPAILSGCEVIPFSEQTIEAIECIQAKLAKAVLCLPASTPNICAQTELGLKPFRLLLWQHQLSFYLRALTLPSKRWVSMALEDHLSGSWESPYMVYITKVRQKVNLLEMAPSQKYLKEHLESWALEEVNSRVSRLSCTSVNQLGGFARELYVCEEEGVSGMAAFRMGSAGLGNREPREGGVRQTQCSLCSGRLDERHVAFSCSALEGFRKKETEITFFRNLCRRKEIHERQAYLRFVNGFDWNGNRVMREEYVRRGVELQGIKKYWLSLTGYRVYYNCLILFHDL